MKIYEAIANALTEEGVSTIFGLMGDGNLRLLTYWTGELGQAYYGTCHESAAVAMADGYARVSGSVGVCTVTQGPGVTNTLTALVSARKARTPLVLMVGDVASFQKGWPQDIDHDQVFRAAEVSLITIDNRATAFSDVIKAIRRARILRVPIGINMPIDVQEQEWNAWDDETSVPSETLARAQLDAAAVSRAADLLAGAQRPVIIGGRGAVESDCATQLVSIGDQVGSIFATTLRGKGLFGDHEYCVGIAGGLGSNLSAQLIGEADVALVVGASLNAFTTMRGSLLRDTATVVRCDVDPTRLAGSPSGSVTLGGDARDVMDALDAELRRRGTSNQGYRPRASEPLATYRPEDEFRPVNEPDALDPRSLVIRLDQLVPKDRTVVTDAGHFFGYPVAYMSVPDARAFVCGIDFGSIGLGIGLAMGAAVARPDRATVLFVGDGGMLMSLGDLETAIRYQFPLCIVVLNDAAYGSELQILRLWELPERLSVFPATDFSAVATALGGRGVALRSEDDLTRLGDELTWGPGPTLVDCSISRAVRAAWLEEAFRH